MRVEAVGEHHVQGILALRQNAAPKVQGEIWVYGAQSRNKMTLESVNALFNWIGAVIMGWHKFQFVLVLINNNVLQFLGALIVHLVDSWVKSPFFQVAKNLFVDSDVFFNIAVFHGAYNNSICVKLGCHHCHQRKKIPKSVCNKNQVYKSI